MTPLETAVFWTEYVARHKGAPLLQSAAKKLGFLEFHNLDVILAILAVVLLPLVVLVVGVRKLFKGSGPGVKVKKH